MLRIWLVLKSNCSRIESSKIRMKNYCIRLKINIKRLNFCNNFYNNCFVKWVLLFLLNQCCFVESVLLLLLNQCFYFCWISAFIFIESLLLFLLNYCFCFCWIIAFVFVELLLLFLLNHCFCFCWNNIDLLKQCCFFNVALLFNQCCFCYLINVILLFNQFYFVI